ncbi:methyltransferase [Winogradskyella sp. PC-19]|uniref:O-methyltransferase n=1 Tax=unclassified Winogradskyella TaxID=2615021 RepID=UPI000B3C100D|nr:MULTISPECIES: class I SAM-dependent methyltransferase [unclassified Winogradskyella]ARV10724.1 methyltransferase [Winogradskyella sp. PC-19]RZN76069.1 MAG: class I SAM-dependent methyltransferase [Winogradskyella sp.]
MYQIITYIKFLLKSTNQHGVHSPFMYDFVTKCLYDKKKYDTYLDLKAYRNGLLNSEKSLEITDFGAGSKLLDANKRKVSKMVNISSSSFKDTKLLYRISQYFKFKNTLELGTSLGVGTQALALGNPSNQITTIEGCPNTFRFSEGKFKKLHLSNIICINSDFESAINKLEAEHFDCIFFDGHHKKDATLEYFNLLLTKAHNDSVFIFDDIYWSKDMTQAWELIISNSKVTASIDCYNFGFIFFRKEQPKQHFRIRL